MRRKRMDEVPVGYCGQRYEVRFKDDVDGPWKVFGWQELPVGGIVAALSKWPKAVEVDVVEVPRAVREIFEKEKRKVKSNV